MKLIKIGFGNMVSAGRLIAIVSPESAPIKRMVQEARDRGCLVDFGCHEELLPRCQVYREIYLSQTGGAEE